MGLSGIKNPEYRRLEGAMTGQEHMDRHAELHRKLDELLADWFEHTDARPSTSTVLDLIKWSHAQSEGTNHHPMMSSETPARNAEAHTECAPGAEGNGE